MIAEVDLQTSVPKIESKWKHSLRQVLPLSSTLSIPDTVYLLEQQLKYTSDNDDNRRKELSLTKS